MKTAVFERPSLLELNKECVEDFDKAMLPQQLMDNLKEESGDSNVAMTLLPQFGFLYIATKSQVHQYDHNVLEFKEQPFQIIKNGSNLEIVQELDDGGSMKAGKNVLFRFGTYNDESLEQAKMVAKEMEPLLECGEIKVVEN